MAVDDVQGNKVPQEASEYSEIVRDLDSFSFEDSHQDQQSDDDESAKEAPKAVESKKPKLKYGRDKNGLFNNHMHFVQLRNRINSLEQGHQALFDRINKRLREENFLEVNEQFPVEYPVKDYKYGQEDWDCYRERYQDVKNIKDSSALKEHFDS